MNHMPNRCDKKTGQLYFAKILKQGDKNMIIYSFSDELYLPPYKHIFYQNFQKLIF